MLDLVNYPDSLHTTFEEEYDWELRDTKGVLCRYITHIEGSSRFPDRKKQTRPNPMSYWFFVRGAVTLINKPELVRDCRAHDLTGGFVVNYVNSIDIEDLLPKRLNDIDFVKKFDAKKHLIPVQYSAMFARVFNKCTPGLKAHHLLKTVDREPKLGHCPHCDAVYEVLTGKSTLPGQEGYEYLRQSLKEQVSYRNSKDTHG